MKEWSWKNKESISGMNLSSPRVLTLTPLKYFFGDVLAETLRLTLTFNSPVRSLPKIHATWNRNKCSDVPKAEEINSMANMQTIIEAKSPTKY